MEIKIKCIIKVTGAQGGLLIFAKNKEYTATVSGSSLMVKDETGCLRTIATNKEQKWSSDKFFKETFKVVES